ncbi:MAG: VOC family protein [Candidatus Dormibacteraeota bacterium]|uniref:Glyoxalase n=1 Tax=Candidatus Aeolococcus gillhamiae TaxID=3127015 RepID=A0A2W5Z009_9BACT|nr:VOC family protein [Candidatus Dormibacteraeota bacterium]PZR78440.1 MAG: glyoxalase [Candidatus Dormibacter sp. RRmetagenome_bin12]
MDWKIELIFVPVTDVDVARDFYAQKCGFTIDYDVRVSEGLRFVQLTPPGSACSIAVGEGITQMEPGTQNSIQVVIADAAAAMEELRSRGVETSDVDTQPWGLFVTFNDPDGNRWVLQQLPQRE